MYFTYDKFNYVVNCDWLQFSVTIEDIDNFELYCPEGFRMEIQGGNNVFRHRAILYRCEDSAKFLTLLWSPYSRLIKRDLMTCQVGNMLLYNGGIKYAYRLLLECVPCYFNSMGRIDVCLDFATDDFIMSVIRKMWTGEYYIQGKREGSAFWHLANDAKQQFVHCMSWGSKTSEIKVKVYNKTRELGITDDNIDGDKPWIVRQWITASLDIRKVWRIEFSLCSSGQLRWQGQPIILDNVVSSQWLIDVFLSLYNRRFVVRENLGMRQGHHNDDPIRVFLVLPKSSEMLRWGGTEDEPTATSDQITLLRRLMGALELPAAQCSEQMFSSLANTIMDLCEHKGVTSYFSHVYGDTPVNVLQSKFQSVGGGKVEVAQRLGKIE